MIELTARATGGAQRLGAHHDDQAGARAVPAIGETLVRIIAARFMEAEAASRALSRMRVRLDLGPDDVGIAPLGGADQPQEAKILLAGRFREARLDEIRQIIQRAGGEIVADLDEGRTRPRRPSKPAAAQGAAIWAELPQFAKG